MSTKEVKKAPGLVKPDAVAVVKASNLSAGSKRSVIAKINKMSTQETIVNTAVKTEGSSKVVDPSSGPKKVRIVIKAEAKPARKNVAPPKPPVKVHRDDVTSEKPNRATKSEGTIGKAPVMAKIPTIEELAKLASIGNKQSVKAVENTDRAPIKLSTVAEGLRQLQTQSFAPSRHVFKTK